jgi:UDP-N-acetylglucosamine 4,6-dehydratase
MNKSILITGGTGSLGKSLISYLIKSNDFSKIVVYSRDELKQYNLRNYFLDNEKIRWFIGDVRDKDRLSIALNGIDFVIHAAALKQVDTGEYNPMEFIKTNIIGTQNVIDAAVERGVKKIIGISTDKASSPINLYGATKLTGDKLLISANNYSQGFGTKISVVRYGNVAGSRGSIIPLFKKLGEKGQDIPITDPRMTRFIIKIENAVNFIMESISIMKGGELYVPKIPSVRISELAKIIAPKSRQIPIGIRPGEKLHEEMISADDMFRATLTGRRYIVHPVYADWGYKVEGKFLNLAEPYNSMNNTEWLNKEDIEKLISTIEE